MARQARRLLVKFTPPLLEIVQHLRQLGLLEKGLKCRCEPTDRDFLSDARGSPLEQIGKARVVFEILFCASVSHVSFRPISKLSDPPQAVQLVAIALLIYKLASNSFDFGKLILPDQIGERRQGHGIVNTQPWVLPLSFAT